MARTFAAGMLAPAQQRTAFRQSPCRSCNQLRIAAGCPPATSHWLLQPSRTAAFRAAPCHTLSRSRQLRHLGVRANWNAEIEWQTAKVMESKPAAEGGLQSLVVDIGALAAGYKIPGQFVQIKVGDSKPGFYAIASPPDANNQGCVELLIKSVPGTTSEILAGSLAGLEVDVSPVMGKGFNLNAVPAAEVDTLLLFATGTGIAPIRALLLSERLQTSERKDVRLYYGTVAPESTAYQSDAAAWGELNVEVINVYSNGKNYYVQDAFAQGPALAEGAVAGALVIGQKEMFQAVSEQLAQAGVPSDRILTNF